MRKIALVVHNVRSAQNVGSLLRTADGLGADQVYLTGYTPYPETSNDSRLPHQRQKQTRQIQKTALGAENFLEWEYETDVMAVLRRLRHKGYLAAVLEQTPGAVELNSFQTDRDVALVVGNEIDGVDKSILEQVKTHLQIPMSGRKESFNVAVAAAIALYHLRYMDKAAA